VATILAIRVETPDVRTFTVQPDGEPFARYRPGQCAMISCFGIGEAMISITSTWSPQTALEFSVKRVGRVTTALHQAEPGHKVGIRGPYGNSFPVDQWAGRNLLFVGGGIGLAPLRSVINHCLSRRNEFGRVDIVYGARSPRDLCFRQELFESWPKVPGVSAQVTVDAADGEWNGPVALVPPFLEQLKPEATGTVAVTCGPPVMIRYTLEALGRLGFADDEVFTTLELKMQCGVGKCGRCSIGPKYVCVDGPVFSRAELKRLPAEY
jgi:NAD(P)H-flavin reductase